MLPGWKIGDEVKYQEYAASTTPNPALGNLPAMEPNGKEAVFDIVKVRRQAPDGTRVQTLTLERVK